MYTLTHPDGVVPLARLPKGNLAGNVQGVVFISRFAKANLERKV